VDEEGSHFEDGKVRYARGTQEALDQLTKAELMGFTLPRKYDGLNFPTTIYTMAIEMVSRADAGSFVMTIGKPATVRGAGRPASAAAFPMVGMM
jgi:alkylation response protein AidB-like acyl-CoA dehydrogenase